jgi:hypothetical protein
MQFSTMIGAAALVFSLAGCGAGGPGNLDVSDDREGPFSGSGSPGPFAGSNRPSVPAFRLGNPGPFSGNGAPRIVGQPVVSLSTLCSSFCSRQRMICPPGTGGSCQELCSELNGSNECERNLWSFFLTCLLNVEFTCNENGIVQNICVPPNVELCRGTMPPRVDAGTTRDAQ